MTLRVLHLVSPLECSGAGRQVELLARMLAAEPFEHQVVNLAASGPGAEGPIAATLQAAGVTVHMIPLRGPINPIAAWRLRRLRRRIQPHILHAWGLRASTLARLAGGARRITTIRMLGDEADGRIGRAVLRSSDRIVVNCEAVRGRLQELGVAAEKTMVIPPGIEPPAAAVAGPLPPELMRDDVEMILVVGRVDAQHRTYDLIHAYDIMAVNRPNLRLVFAGDGPLRQPARARRRYYRAADRIHFLGRRDDVPYLMSRAAVVWRADEREGIPQSLLETMSAGVPIVARTTASLRDLFTHGETAMLVSPERIMEYCKWQQRLLDDDAVAACIGHAGRALAAERFSSAEFARRHAELYCGL